MFVLVGCMCVVASGIAIIADIIVKRTKQRKADKAADDDDDNSLAITNKC